MSLLCSLLGSLLYLGFGCIEGSGIAGGGGGAGGGGIVNIGGVLRELFFGDDLRGTTFSTVTVLSTACPIRPSSCMTGDALAPDDDDSFLFTTIAVVGILTTVLCSFVTRCCPPG